MTLSEILSKITKFFTKKKKCCEHTEIEQPKVEVKEETKSTEVEKITERLIDVSSKPLTLVDEKPVEVKKAAKKVVKKSVKKTTEEKPKEK